MSDWPIDLPQKLNSSGFSYVPEDNTVQSEVDMGKPKQRRRYTAKVINVTGEVTLDSQSQIDSFLYFWDTLQQDGTLPFTWNDPLTGEEKQMEFTAPYSLSNTSGHIFTLSIEFRILP